PKLRFGGPPSKLQPSPPSTARIMRGARSRSAGGTPSNTCGGSLTWQSAEMMRSGVATMVRPFRRRGSREIDPRAFELRALEHALHPGVAAVAALLEPA